MRNMREHSIRLSWVAGWCRWLSYFALVGFVLFVLLIVAFILLVRGNAVVAGVRMSSGVIITQLIGAALGSLVTAFIWRAGFALFAFLSDFAAGLEAQYIQRIHREHANKS